MATATQSVVDSPGARKRDLAAIHMGAASLGWIVGNDRSIYVDLLWTVCRVRSAADLDFTGRKQFLDHIRQCGWVSKPQLKRSKKLLPMQGKIWSIWQALADAGAVKTRTMRALETYVTRQTGVSKLVWLNPQQQALIIESLKQWLKRTEAQPHTS